MGTSELIKKILADARAQVEAILREKERQIAEVQRRATATQAQLKTENAQKIRERTQAILDNARSRAELEKKKILLQARWGVINSVCEKAKQAILSRPDYLTLLQHLIEKFAPPGATVHLSPADSARFNRAPRHSERSEESLVFYSLTFRIGEPLPISGGVVIQHGREKFDLSLDTVLSEARDDLITALARNLSQTP